MCGIAGIISQRQNKLQELQQMISCIGHRGPDGEAVWQNDTGTAALGHRRLSVIDLSDAAAQPMPYMGRYTIVHNGEVYNCKELRQELSQQGFAFRSQSDTEVVLAAYHHWKQDCLQYFDGMFAFAIWDEQEQKLFAARDRFGEKPFYYIVNDDGLWFASEIKAFRKAGFEKNYNGNLLLQYLANGFTQDAMDAGATFDVNIARLPARHYLEYSSADKSLSVQAYFDIDKTYGHSVTASDAVAVFRERFFLSVARRLRSDVPVGTSLSGGLDSSSVVAAIHQLHQSSFAQKTFTVSFPGFEKDETAYAAAVAKRFGLQHFIVEPSPAALVADLEKFFGQHDEPVSSSSVYAQYKVYELAKQQGVKVVLDGQGADEVLAGYPKYVRWYLQELFVSGNRKLLQQELDAFRSNGSNMGLGFKDKLASKFPSFAAVRLEKKAIRRQKTVPFISAAFVSEHLGKWSIQKPVVRTLNDILYDDVFGGRLEELLRNADRNAMAHGIEVRLPFLDHELVQFVFSLPAIFKIHDGYPKYVLRQAMDDLLPGEITWRKEKTGFEPPQRQWMRDALLQEKIHEAKRKLVREKILTPSVLDEPVQPRDAFDADNYDWRFLNAAQLL